jgi:hypothetical protein
MITIKNLIELKNKKISRYFKYNNMLFTLSSLSSNAFSNAFIDTRYPESISWRAYENNGGDSSEITMIFKSVGNKIIPYKIIHKKL